MRVVRLTSNPNRRALLLVAGLAVVLFAGTVTAQTIDPELRPDWQRALMAQPDSVGGEVKGRANGYTPAQAGRSERPRETLTAPRRDASNVRSFGSALSHASNALNIPATSSIQPGTPLTQIFHTSQVSLVSSAGTDEQFIDRNGD